MARRGGMLGGLRGQGSSQLGMLVAEVHRELAHRTDLALPADQYALVSIAAERIAPTLLTSAGLPVTEEYARTLGTFLVTVWGNALLGLDRPTIERLHEERVAGN